MSRLIVLSNRVKLPDNKPMAGGLAVALNDVLIEHPAIWMGWNSEIIESETIVSDEDSLNHSAVNKFHEVRHPISADLTPTQANISYVTTALSTKQYQHFYCGFANNVLWLLLHESTDLITQDPMDFAGYQAVNRLFAEQLQRIIEPDDVIWVHDYHFLSVAYYCRKLGIKNRIGFFLHVPFAAPPFWQSLDQSAELIAHLAHYDLVGVQSQRDKANCLAVLKQYLADNIVSGNQDCGTLTLKLDEASCHKLTVEAYPIGINVAKIQQEVQDLSLLQSKNSEKTAAQQIIAVDRIDYSKGLLERFSAYAQFLQRYPEYQQQLNLFQIACPSRLDLPVYQRLYEKVKQAVGEVNAEFSLKNNNVDDLTPHWQPITYSETVRNRTELMAAFWQSDVCWVNSLKDGMNLVAKEYIAAQNPQNPGVLLLSCYTGAAEQMTAAVIIDPNDPQSMIEGLKLALTMPLSERKLRHQMLLQGLKEDNLAQWQRSFLEDLCPKNGGLISSYSKANCLKDNDLKNSYLKDSHLKNSYLKNNSLKDSCFEDCQNEDA